MKKLLIISILSFTAITSIAATANDNTIDTEDRIYFTKDKGAWIFKDGFVIDPPYVSFWTGINAPIDNAKARSSKILVTFDCRKQKYRFEAGVEYSQLDNKGKKISEDIHNTAWWPIEPGTIFNAMGKAACRRIK